MTQKVVCLGMSCVIILLLLDEVTYSVHYTQLTDHYPEFSFLFDFLTSGSVRF